MINTLSERRLFPLKYMRQFGIILAFSLAGEALSKLIPLPIPASIYGIILLLTSLSLGLLRVEQIRETSAFLIRNMPILFVPAAAGLMDAFPLLKEHLIAYIAITAISTVLVMGVAGRAAQAMLRREGKTHE